MLKKIFDFFVFSSLFIALCALVMTYQTSFLFNIPFPFALAGFVFCGTVCSYNFHWYLTPPDLEKPTEKLAWNISNKTIHLLLFIMALAGAGVFSILLINHWFWLGLTAFITFLYSAPKIPYPLFSRLKKVAIGKTIFLAMAWMHVTALLPLVIILKTLEVQHVWYIINRFFFIYSICILFDFRDVAEDKKAGIKSMITYLTEKGIDKLFWSSLMIFFISSFIMLRFFSLITIIALLIPGIILAMLYYPSKKNFSDYLYYFVLDGLMMLSAPLLLLINLSC